MKTIGYMQSRFFNDRAIADRGNPDSQEILNEQKEMIMEAMDAMLSTMFRVKPFEPSQREPEGEPAFIVEVYTKMNGWDVYFLLRALLPTKEQK